MTYRTLLCVAACALILVAVACTQRRPETPAMQPEVVPPGPVAKTPAPRSIARAGTLEAYKVQVAQRIASTNTELFGDPLPPMLKSVVVLQISIDRDGLPQEVSVRRSNGIRELEQRAQASVRAAAPFDAPAQELLRGASTVRFLETFLFRDDGRFQIRSLVND